MKKDRSFTDGSKLVAIRLPRPLKALAEDHCKREDTTLSQLMRRALRKEVEGAQ